MKVYNMKQYSDEYWQLKLGRLSASSMKKVVSSSGKVSSSWKDYVFKQIAELETGFHEDDFSSFAMQRGLEIEPLAKDSFTRVTSLKVQDVGIILSSEYDFLCCSPDGLGDNFGLEIKCPSPGVHLKTRFENRIPPEYQPQVYSSLWMCTEVERWYFYSYHPKMEPVIIETKRDNPDYIAYINKLKAHIIKVAEFIEEVKKYI